MPNAVLNTSTGTGYVVRYGDADFTAGLAGDETQVPLDEEQTPVLSPLYYNTVTAGAFVALSAGDQAIAEADVVSRKQAATVGGIPVQLQYGTEADLPSPPPRPFILAVVVSGVSGRPELVISDDAQWYRFASAVVP